MQVEDIHLECCTLSGPRLDNSEYYLSLPEIECQAEQVEPNINVFNKYFNVHPKTHSLTLAFQERQAGLTQVFSPAKFKCTNSGELGLNRFSILYANKQLPSPDSDASFKEDVLNPEDYMIHRYLETITQTGAFFDTGGTESIDEWRDRGAYYHFKWPKEIGDMSTLVRLRFQLSLPLIDGNVLMFSHYKRIMFIGIQDGKIREVREV